MLSLLSIFVHMGGPNMSALDHSPTALTEDPSIKKGDGDGVQLICWTTTIMDCKFSPPNSIKRGKPPLKSRHWEMVVQGSWAGWLWHVEYISLDCQLAANLIGFYRAFHALCAGRELTGKIEESTCELSQRKFWVILSFHREEFPLWRD